MRYSTLPEFANEIDAKDIAKIAATAVTPRILALLILLFFMDESEAARFPEMI
jgi:hypothetical protein